MTHKILLASAQLLSLVLIAAATIGCTGEQSCQPDPTTEPVMVDLHVSAGDATRSLALEGKTVRLYWDSQAQSLHLYFRQEGQLLDGGLYAPSGVDDDEAYFRFALHPQVDAKKPFDLIGIVARRTELRDGRVLVGVEAHSLYSIDPASDADIEDLPTYFIMEKVSLQGDPLPVAQLQHLGALAVIWVRNSSSLSLPLAGAAVLPMVANGPFYQKGALPFVGNEELPFLDLLDLSAKPTMIKSRIRYPKVDIAAGETVPLGFWLRPLDGQTNTPPVRVALYDTADRNPIFSKNIRSARTTPLELGHAYHIYAEWDGKQLVLLDKLP